MISADQARREVLKQQAISASADWDFDGYYPGDRKLYQACYEIPEDPLNTYIEDFVFEVRELRTSGNSLKLAWVIVENDRT